MSVLIKGMEMPESCFACPFRRKVDPDNIMCIVTREVFEETFAGTIEFRNRGNCPLAHVPKHGRLIDADVRCNVEIYDDQYEDFQIVNMSIDDLLDSSWIELEEDPTIIPADPAEEGE